MLALLPGAAVSPSGWTVVAWNNLGMHCMDADFSLFAILPPYNTIHAHVVDPSGRLVKSGASVSVTYEAVADPDGSINTTSRGKTNFWDHVVSLFGAALPVDAGLAGKDMPGPANAPKAMTFQAAQNWFVAEGIPITPFDDAGRKNPYPLMKVTARDAAGNVLASTRIVLPVSDEMDCRGCHGSGTADAARPAAGWAFDPDPEHREDVDADPLPTDRHGRRAPVHLRLLARVRLEGHDGLRRPVPPLPKRCHVPRHRRVVPRPASLPELPLEHLAVETHLGTASPQVAAVRIQAPFGHLPPPPPFLLQPLADRLDVQLQLASDGLLRPPLRMKLPDCSPLCVPDQRLSRTVLAYLPKPDTPPGGRRRDMG